MVTPEEAVQAVRQLQDAIDEANQALVALSAARADLVAELIAHGWTRKDVAGLLGVSKVRVNQILDTLTAREEGEPVRKAPRRGKSAPVGPVRGVSGRLEVPRRARTRTEPAGAAVAEPHRHHYVSTGWNHARGGYLLRQACDCGVTRVIPSPSVPRELSGGPDVSIVA